MNRKRIKILIVTVIFTAAAIVTARHVQCFIKNVEELERAMIEHEL